MSKTLKTIVYTAMSIALVTVATMIIRIPTGEGYVNFGDILIFIIAALIGKRTAVIAGGIGSAIADLIGYPAFTLGTLVIKGVEGLVCASLVRKNGDGSLKKNSVIIASSVAALWMVFGYFVYEYFLYGMATALGSIVGNLIQGGVSAAAAFPIILAVKKSKIKFDIE